MAENERSAAEELGRAIQLRRVELGMKRKDLASAAGLSYPYISEIENGLKEPSAKALRVVAQALEIPTASLLELAGRLGDESGPTSLLMDSDPSRRQDLTGSAWFEASQRSIGNPSTSSEDAPPSAGLLEHWIQEMVTGLVRAELTRWAQTELPQILRDEVGRLSDEAEPS